MKIILKPHLKIRLRERQIPSSYLHKILTYPNQKYFDTHSNHFVAVKKLYYLGKIRPMIISYDIIEEVLEAITIHTLSPQQIANRLKSKRWIKYEEE